MRQPSGLPAEDPARAASGIDLPLPDVGTADAFRTWRRDAERWRPLVARLAEAHRLEAANPQAYATGTNLVVALDARHVLKLYPPIHRSQFLSERATLRRLQGRLSIAIPDMVAEGEQDRWGWLVLTRLDGTVGSEIWPHLPEEQKESVLRQIVETIAEVQSVPPGEELALIGPDWRTFIAGQIEGCRARHARLGLPDRFLDGIGDLLRDAAEIVPMDAPPAILTGEYIPENFLLHEKNGQWRLAGLFDFGDVMTGWKEYDLLGPSAFMAAGRPERVRCLFEGYGYSRSEMDAGLTHRLLVLMLLHRASDLRNICIEDWPRKIGRLEELAALVWPLAD